MPPKKEAAAPKPSDHLRAMYHHLANWKRHAEQLYNFQQTQMLEWPCLSLDWLPDRKRIEDGRDYSLQYLACGTQALPGSQNYVSVMEFCLPLDKEDAEDFYHYEAEDIPDDKPDPFQFESVKGHSRLDQVVQTDGSVLKLRAMPQLSDILAVKTTTGYVSLYHLDRRPKVDTDSPTSNKPDLRLKGHRVAGFALAWHPDKPGYLASGADDHQVLCWDIESHQDTLGAHTEDNRSGVPVQDVPPTLALTGHKHNVHDVSWHSSQEHILGSVSEDRSCRLWDTRSSSASAVVIEECHKGTAFGISMHPTAAFQFATCGGDRILKLWDMRRPNAPCHSMIYHSNAITSVSWAPFSETVLATSGADRRVVLWDIAKMDQEATNDGDANAPPELSFLHTGHISRVTDVVWNPSLEDEWLLASADMTNCMQVWKPQNEVVYDYLNTEQFDQDMEQQ